MKRLNEAMVKIMAMPKVSGKIAGMELQARSSSPDEARGLLKADVNRRGAVLKAAGILLLD